MNETETNRAFVARHIEAINRREVDTVLDNIHPDLVDHEIVGDHNHDLQLGTERFKALLQQFPDLSIDVRDILADNDKVVVRAVWSGTNKETQKLVEFHGFLQFRIADGKMAERWATVTPLAEMSDATKHW